MFPHLFNLGPWEIKTYGLMVALGFLLAIVWSTSQAKKLDISSDIIMDIALLSMIFGVLGARLLYVVVNWRYFANNPTEIIMVHHGGLVLYGGVIFAIAADFTYLKWKKARVWDIADLIAPGIFLGQATGRLGCFFNGCCYGLPTKSFLGVRFPPGSGAFFQYPGERIVPLQLFSALANFLLFLFLWLIFSRRRFSGQIFSIYGILYSLNRFIIEFFRGDIERGYYGWLSTSQWISLCFMSFFIFLYWQREKSGEENI